MDREVGPGAAVGVDRLVDWTTYSLGRLPRAAPAWPDRAAGTAVLAHPVEARGVTEAPARDYASVRRDLAAMGETPGLVALMEKTPAAHLHWMTPEELGATRLATGRDGIGAWE